MNYPAQAFPLPPNMPNQALVPRIVTPLHSHTLNLLTDGADLAGKVRSLVGRDRDRDDRTADTGSPAKSELGRDVDVRGVLVLGQQGNVQDNRERGGVRSEDNKFAIVCQFVHSSARLDTRTYLVPRDTSVR